MKNYLRAYVKYAQNDWVDHLSNAKFTTNNHENVFTDMTSFFANHDYHSRIDTESSETYDLSTSKKVELARADNIIARQNKVKNRLIDHITWTQADQAKHVNRTRIAHPEYKVGDLVYVNSKNFATDRHSPFVWTSVVFEFPWNSARNARMFEIHSPDILSSHSVCSVYLVSQIVAHRHRVHVSVDVRGLFAETRETCREIRSSVDFFAEIGGTLSSVSTGTSISIVLFRM